MRTLLAPLLLAVGTATAYAQQPEYTFEMRLIADGEAGAPSGPGQVYPNNIFADPRPTRIGFWLQARVSVTGDAENWGIVRASSPSDGASSIQMYTVHTASLGRGTVNGANTNYGRGTGYRNGGVATGHTGNTGNSQPFPGIVGNENGALDNGGSGELINRIYGFNSFVGATRAATNPGEPSQPWNVNGALGAGAPVAPEAFSPWANLYRFWVDISSYATLPPGHFPGDGLYITASAQLFGSLRAAPTDPSMTTWAMVMGPGQLMTATWGIPSPSACSVLVFASAFVTRRRRF